MGKSKGKKGYAGRSVGARATEPVDPQDFGNLSRPAVVTQFMLCPATGEGAKACRAKAKRRGVAVLAKQTVKIRGAGTRKAGFRYTSPTISKARGQSWSTAKRKKLCEHDGKKYTGRLKGTTRRAFECKPQAQKPCKKSFWETTEEMRFSEGKDQDQPLFQTRGSGFARSASGKRKKVKLTRARLGHERRCPIELVYDQGQPMLRICTYGPEHPGTLVPAPSKEAALRLSHQACGEYLRSSNFSRFLDENPEHYDEADMFAYRAKKRKGKSRRKKRKG